MMIGHKELKSLLSYDPETGNFIWLINASSNARIGDIAGHLRKRDGYTLIRINEKGYQAHRLAWFYVHGVWPALIDHKDRNKSNNALSNLREATTSQNAMNAKATCLNTSGYRGVTWNKASGKWQAQSRLNGRNHYLGLFESAPEASEAYEDFCKKHHGQFFSGNLEVAA